MKNIVNASRSDILVYLPMYIPQEQDPDAISVTNARVAEYSMP